MSKQIPLIDDVIEHKTRQLFFSCEHQELVNLIIDSNACINYNKIGIQYMNILLCTDEFLQSIDVIRDMHPHKEKSLEDYFVSENEDSKEEDEEYVTSVVIHPYTSRTGMSEKTGRNYMKEMNNCVKYIKKISGNQ